MRKRKNGRKLGPHDYVMRRMVPQLLDAVTPALVEIAGEMGFGYHAIRKYRDGLRTPPPKVCRALISAARRRARQLERLADALETAQAGNG